MTDDDLPPLPETDDYLHPDTLPRTPVYFLQSMRDYARAAIRHWIARQQPVAWRVVVASGKFTRALTEAEPKREDFDLGESFVPLFRLDGGGDDKS